MFDPSKYEAGRRQVESGYAAKKSSNEFGRFVSQRQGQRRMGDYKRTFGRQQSSFMGDQAQRGMVGGGVRSGTFRQALQRRTGDYTRDLGRMADDDAMDARRFDLEGANIDRWRQESLAELEMQKSREIAAAAMNIAAIRPLLG